MTTLGTTVPFYGGGQVPNPSNVLIVKSTPSANLKVNLGTLAVEDSTGTAWIAASLVGGVTTWSVIGGGTSEVSTVNGLSPVAGNIIIAPTTGQISVTSAGHTVTLSLPSAITAPGSLATTTTLASGTTFTAGTGITATTGNIVATAGNISTTAGSISSHTTLTAGTGITATTGAITATAGSLVAGGDTGGVASSITLSNVNSTTISSGAGSVAMSSTNDATNTAWLKIYIGTSAYWIPAWTTNSP